MAVVEVNDVSICYITGDFKQIGLKEYLIRRIKRDYHVKEFWADRHVSFELQKGDMLGIVGINGAGKSTLLKCITGIMPPTEGKVSTKGRIAALLELTSGFDGELTVRENTFLRGALLGYSKQFIVEKYDEIIKFAELEEFEDYKFNQLSSGMKSRLAFSIACLVDPNIIILDEVLSVGDGAFKEKSARRMKEILDNGVTGLFVSHSVEQVRELCNKVLWLDKGKQIAFGNTKEICDAYEHFLATPKGKRVLPKSMDEIVKTSKDYDLYTILARKERENGENIEVILNESKSKCEQRWMKTISKMSSEEKEKILAEAK